MISSLRWLWLLFIITGGLALAQTLPSAKPEEVGFSSQRLARIDVALQKAIDAGDFPGAVALVARKGKVVYFKSFGLLDKATNRPMSTDAIFRIYSMTKPIVSVAAMALLEEGRLGLHEPVSKYLPEFKEMRVALESYDPVSGAQSFTTVSAKRPITIQDLFRHTSGFTYGALGGKSQVKELYKQAGIGSLEQLYKADAKWTNDSFAQAIAKLPLRFEPGTQWEYGHSTDVLGRVVEVVAQQPLDVFLAERILRPLKMIDSAFHVTQDKLNRVAQPQKDAKSGEVPELLDVSKPATWFAAGHGMVATTADYYRFCQMLLNGGELDGARILGRKSIAYMSSNHVGPQINLGAGWLPGPGHGFGLGFGVREHTGLSDWPGSPGEYYWGGYAGTYFWIDPSEQLVALLMFQNPVVRQHYRALYRALVLQALTN